MNEIIRQLPDWLIPALILCMSVVAVAIIIDRLRLLLLQIKPLSVEREDQLWELLRKGDHAASAEFCLAQAAGHPALGVIAALVQARQQGRRTAGIIEAELHRANAMLKRYLQALGTISTVAPLLGLLGTVTGMIKSFHAFDAVKVQNAQLVGGIDEALITTTLGLIVAIPSLIAYNYLANRVNVIAEETAILAERAAEEIGS